MKKIMKLSAVVSVILLICLSFSGCDKVTKLQKNQGFYGEEGEILLGGETFVQLIPSDAYEEMYFEQDYENTYRVTQKDVPALISLVYGDCFYKSKDGILLISDSDASVYCRADKAEEMNRELNSEHDYTVFLYDYYAAPDTLFGFNFETKNRILTETEIAALKRITETVTPKPRGDIPYDDEAYGEITVYACTENRIFREEAFTIAFDEENYYLEIYNEAKETCEEYTVPENFKETLEIITKEYKETW